PISFRSRGTRTTDSASTPTAVPVEANSAQLSTTPASEDSASPVVLHAEAAVPQRDERPGGEPQRGATRIPHAPLSGEVVRSVLGTDSDRGEVASVSVAPGPGVA